MKRFLLFDLGETLVKYLSRGTFRDSLPVVFESMYSKLRHDLPGQKEGYWTAMQREGYQNTDYTVRRLETRLSNAFGVPEETIERNGLCELFLAPILESSSIYDDTEATVKELSRRYTLAVVSNTPWGSPKEGFERDLERHGINCYFAHAVFCRDVGYRKPHAAIFEHALGLLGATPSETLMVGDRYDWDIVGANQCGVDAILLDRDQTSEADCRKIARLADLLSLNLERDVQPGLWTT